MDIYKSCALFFFLREGRCIFTYFLHQFYLSASAMSWGWYFWFMPLYKRKPKGKWISEPLPLGYVHTCISNGKHDVVSLLLQVAQLTLLQRAASMLGIWCLVGCTHHVRAQSFLWDTHWEVPTLRAMAALHLGYLSAGCCHQVPLPALLQAQHGVQVSYCTFLPQLSESSMEPLSQHCSWASVSPFCQYAVTILSKSHLRLKIKQHRLNFFIPLPKAICTVAGFDMQHCALQTHVTHADSERGNVCCHALHCSCSDAQGEASALGQSLSPGFFILLQLFKLGFGPGLFALVVSASFQMFSALGPPDEHLVPMPQQHSQASANGAFAGIDACPW